MSQAVFEEDRFVLAFYGFERSSQVLESFYHYIVEWFNELGYPPDGMGVAGTGHGKKLGTFRGKHALLMKTGFDEIESFEILSSLPNASIPAARYYLCTLFSHEVSYGGYATIAMPTNIPCVKRLEYTRSMIDILSPTYGIAYNRPLPKGPVEYAMGLNYGGDLTQGVAYERRVNVTQWGRQGLRKEIIEKGLLREVYPWNFLTKLQLNYPVHDRTLAEWINADPNRGNLKPFEKDMFLWEIDDARIENIREFLYEANVIYDMKKHLAGVYGYFDNK